ncbi:MAG: hypothetical protein ACK5MJ_03860 [Alphaproteobacteria bacterium]
MLKKQIITTLLCLIPTISFAFGGYDDGSRWAFVSDSSSNKVAIIDTLKQSFMENKELKTIPTQIIISDLKDLLLYHNKVDKVIYAIDLKEGKEWEIPLDFTPLDIVFYPDGSKFAVVGEGHISIIDPITKEISGIIKDINNPVSINFSSDGYKLFITERNNGKTQIWSVYHQFSRKLQMGDGHAVSNTSLSANSLFAMVTSQNNLLIYNRVENKKLAPVRLSQDGLLGRPYFSSDSKNIVVASNDGQAFILKPWLLHSPRIISIAYPPNIIRTGWLESLGIISGQSKITIFPLDKEDKSKDIPTQGYVNDMVVTSDSKRLFATQSESTKVKVINLRSQEVKDIETNLKQPHLIVMGRTNTVCN